MTVTVELAKKVVETVDQGLVRGLGTPTPGNMCVEAAVCYAMGLPHSDQPTCVHPNVRSIKIRLNDCEWSSSKDRAAGMRRIAVAQLGSDQIDGDSFVAAMRYHTYKNYILPYLKQDGDPRMARLVEYFEESLQSPASLPAATSCISSMLAYLNQGHRITPMEWTLMWAGRNQPYDMMAGAERALQELSGRRTRSDIYQQGLRDMAEVGVQTLIQLKSPGCEFLYLCEEKQNASN